MVLDTAAGGFRLRARERERLGRHLTEAVRRARRHGEALAALTIAVDPGTDPTAVAVASRRPGEPWFCLEQPDRDGAALATLGAVVELDDAGPARFRRVAARWRRLASHAACDPPEGPR